MDLITSTAYACTNIGDTPTLEVIPGSDGSGNAPILSLPLTSNESADWDDMLRSAGWATVNLAPAGGIRQATAWTDAGDYSVASVVPVGTDTTCPDCGHQSRWVYTSDDDIVCACTLDS